MPYDFSADNKLLWFDRALYFLGLPAVLLNYGISSVITLVLGDPSGASQLTLLVYLLFVFPVAFASMLCVVWAQFTARVRTFGPLVRAGLIAILANVLLIALFFVPSNAGTALSEVAKPGSVMSRFFGVGLDASQGIAQFFIVLLPGVLVYLGIAAVFRARENQREFDDSLSLS